MVKKDNVADEISKLEEIVKDDDKEISSKNKKVVRKNTKSKKLRTKVKDVSKNPLEAIKEKKVKIVEAVVGKTELLKVNPKNLLVVWEDNPRSDYGDMKTLEASILVRGVENPIRVNRLKDGNLKLGAGYRRVKACLNLIEAGEKINSIPAILEKKGTSDKETLIHVFVENDGKSFNPMEEASLFQEMKDEQGMSIDDIGKNIGRSKAAIVSKLSLLKCSEKLQVALRNNVINVLTAQRMIKVSKKDHKIQDKLVTSFEKIQIGGDKKDVKTAKKTIAKGAGEKNITSGIPYNKAKLFLDELATNFINFARTQKPANGMNKAWLELEVSLKKLRTMKRKGQFN